MKARNFKRWVAGLCATAMLAGAPAMVGYAADMTGETTTGETTVTATVIANQNQPTYAITIPTEVKFGEIQQPTAPGSAYATTQITVKCMGVSGLGADQAISVLVKDSNAYSVTDPFLLINNEHKDSTLRYEMLNEGLSIDQTSWYDGGFLYAAFNSDGQTKTMDLRLNKEQLYGKDLTEWGGAYTGTLTFTTKVGSISSVQSMEEGTPVVVW